MGLLENIVTSAVTGALGGSSSKSGSTLKKAATAAAAAVVAKKAVSAISQRKAAAQRQAQAQQQAQRQQQQTQMSEADILGQVLKQLGGNSKSIDSSVLTSILKSQMGGKSLTGSGGLGDIAKSVISVIGMAGK